MRPGSIKIIKCEKCFDLICVGTYTSMNTMNSEIWTDGRIFGIFYSRPEPIVKCPYCLEMIWKEEQEEIDSVPYSNSVPCENIMYVKSLELQDYYDMLCDSNLNNKKERYIRIQIWQLENDSRRPLDGEACTTKRTIIKKDFSLREIYNMKSLLHLLDSNNELERIMLAEVNRNLSRFDVAYRLLDKDFSDKNIGIALFIRRLTIERNPFICIYTSM